MKKIGSYVLAMMLAANVCFAGEVTAIKDVLTHPQNVDQDASNDGLEITIWFGDEQANKVDLPAYMSANYECIVYDYAGETKGKEITRTAGKLRKDSGDGSFFVNLKGLTEEQKVLLEVATILSSGMRLEAIAVRTYRPDPAEN